MKFISHLDLMRLFMRALRRAGIPVKMSEGFNPHPKISIHRALKLGIESDNEMISIVLSEPVEGRDFLIRINPQLPAGITVKSVVPVIR